MNTTSHLSAVFRHALEAPIGVVNLVDELLRLCQEERVQLDWKADCCRIRSLADGAEAVIDKPLRKSVFRAVLARLAALYNEQTPHAVSPYGGHGHLSVGVKPPTLLRVSFANTPDNQWLELMPLPIDELQEKFEQLEEQSAD